MSNKNHTSSTSSFLVIDSAGPCLPRAPRLRVWKSVSFYQSAIIAFVLRGPKYHHEMPHQIQNARFGINKIALFSSLFSKAKKSDKPLPRPPKNDKNASWNSLKTVCMKNRFLQYLLCENNDLEVPNVESPN